jgi:hypothetical protein
LARFIEETDGTAAADAPTEDYAKISSADINQGGRNDAVPGAGFAFDRSIWWDAPGRPSALVRRRGPRS